MRKTTLTTTVFIASVAAYAGCSSDPEPFTPMPAPMLSGAGTAGTATGMGGGAAVGTGGTAGTGGSTATTAGTGGVAATGGSAGAGGTTMGGAGGMTGGAGGEMAAPMGCDGDCTTTFTGDQFDGYILNDTPRDAPGGSDGLQGLGSNNQECQPGAEVVFKEAHFQLAGDTIETGRTYNVTVRVVGVVECKTYVTNGCPVSNANDPGRSGIYDLSCPGAEDNGDIWNTYMLSVTDGASARTPGIGPQDGELPTLDNVYMLNQCPEGIGDRHETWQIDYELTFPVVGGQWVNYVEFDTNCRFILNCGPDIASAIGCENQYVLPVTDTIPPAPAELANPADAYARGGPFGNGEVGFGQWLYFDVKSVVPAE